MDSGESICVVCGDRSAGKHYGVMACYGCKGFFRRTIRSSHAYSCRFEKRCNIDKDLRNACRFCRFQQCLRMGMEPDAIRPDRDIIGKQKNPRRKRMKGSSSSSSIPCSSTEDSRANASTPTGSETSQVDSGFISFLMSIEMQASSGAISSSPHQPDLAIGISRVKLDPDSALTGLFLNRHDLLADCYPMSFCGGRVATVDHLWSSTRRLVASCVHWIDALLSAANFHPPVHERVAQLKSVYPAFAMYSLAARTVRATPGQKEAMCLCNGTVVPRVVPRHLHDTNLLGNNVVARLLDDLVVPISRLSLSDPEMVMMTALVVLDAESPRLSEETTNTFSALRDRVQTALFQSIRENANTELECCSRFGNMLLLLPPLAKVAALLHENVQLAKMFSGHAIDPVVAEIFGYPEESIPSPSIKDRSDVSTQTGAGSPVLPSDLADCIVLNTSSSPLHPHHSPLHPHPSPHPHSHQHSPIHPLSSPSSLPPPPLVRPAPITLPFPGPPFFPPHSNGLPFFPNGPSSAPLSNPFFFDQSAMGQTANSAPDPIRESFRFC